MNIPIFASFIVFCIFLNFNIKRINSQKNNWEADFFEKENASNNVRKQNIDNLNYITIPLDTFPTTLLPDNEEVVSILDTITKLSSQKILNLTGITNTDLKLKYGVANLDVLMNCDQNYTILVRTIQKWAIILKENNYIKESITLLEFCISTQTDISSTYTLLAELYVENKESDKIKHLLEVANTLTTLSKPMIVQKLQEFGPYTD